MIALLHIAFIVSLLAMWKEIPHKSYNKERIRIIVLCIAVILAFFAALRPSTMPDYEAYESIFEFPENQYRIEFGFMYLIEIIRSYISSSFIVFLFLSALICIIIKLLAVTKLSNLFYTSLFIYICSKYISNDLIQMRVAFSTGFMLLGIYFKIKKDLWRFLLVSTLAFIFHYSALLAFFVWFIPTKKINRGMYIAFVVGSYLLAIRGFSITNLIGLVPIQGIQTLYSNYAVLDESANLFSILLFAKMAMCIYFLWNWEKYASKSPYFVIEVQLFAISIILYCLLFTINSIAVRFAELFQIVEIVLIPMFYYISRNRVIGKTIISFVGSIYFFFYVYISGWLL